MDSIAESEELTGAIAQDQIGKASVVVEAQPPQAEKQPPNDPAAETADDTAAAAAAAAPTACDRCCDRTCYKWFLIDRHRLPDDPSLGDRLHNDLLCPPHGRTGSYLTGLFALMLLYATMWSLFPDQSLPGTCVHIKEQNETNNDTCANATASKKEEKLSCTGGFFGLFLLFTMSMMVGNLFGLIPRCPKLLGMMLAGCLLRSVPFLSNYALAIDNNLSSTLRNIALSVILIQAGLGLDPKRLRALSLHVFLLAFTPCLVEAATVGVASHFLLNLPWAWGFLLGFVLAAVSPAVVVPSMLAIRSEGYGIDKGIPTLLIAAASVDDVLAITGFGVLLSIVYGSDKNLALTIVSGPLEALMGVAIGVLLGLVLWFLPPARHKRFIFYRFCFLVACGLAPLLGAVVLKLHGAGALACLTAAFVAAKNLERSAKQCDKAEAAERAKLRRALQRSGGAEAARVHAENAIRQRNQAINYRRLAARVDAVASRVQTAVTMKQVTKSMSGVVKGMEAAMQSMDLQQVSKLMDRFEREFENLDVQSQVMQDSMASSGTLTAPQTQVDALMSEAADEAGIELNMQLPDSAASRGAVGSSTAANDNEQDELTQRLASLRNG